MNPLHPCPGATLYLGDCREVLPALPAGSFDLVFSDPPYPCIQRSYGTWTEAEWWELMRAVVPECMRVLKPAGSAVFVLQPSSERVGRMRTWLWDFMSWVGREWGVVQDAYWWNPETLPGEGAGSAGMLRASVKMCAWVGPPGCFRNQEAVLWEESDANRAGRLAGRCTRTTSPSGWRGDSRAPRFKNEVTARGAAGRRGGVTPFNLLPIGPDGKRGDEKHPARTPFLLCSWWVRYCCPPGGAVLDPFSGSGTTGLAALAHGCDYVGVEAVPEYHALSARRLAEAAGPLFATPEAVCPTT